MRFREVTLQARDPQALAQWYRDALGLPAATGGPAGVVAGATTLRFEPAAGDERPIHHFAFNVPEDRIRDAHAWIRERAPVVAGDEGEIVDFPNWNAHAVYFTDPAGNIGELIARHDLPNARAGPFDGRLLLEVSEVGLPTPDVRALVAELRRALGAPEYRPARDTFAPVGDPRGLLILVAEGRPWFPIGAPARPFPVRIVHEGPAHQVPGLPYRFDAA